LIERGGEGIIKGDYFMGQAETQVWAEMAFRCNYLGQEIFRDIDEQYDKIIGKLVRMIDNPQPWLIIVEKERKA